LQPGEALLFHRIVGASSVGPAWGAALCPLALPRNLCFICAGGPPRERIGWCVCPLAHWLNAAVSGLGFLVCWECEADAVWLVSVIRQRVGAGLGTSMAIDSKEGCQMVLWTLGQTPWDHSVTPDCLLQSCSWETRLAPRRLVGVLHSLGQPLCGSLCPLH
jgi:hypothetical protein